MMNINSPEVQDLIHSAVYGIGIHALECDDFQSLPVNLRMEVCKRAKTSSTLSTAKPNSLTPASTSLTP